MAAEATTADPSQPTEPAAPDWKDEIKKQWFGLKIGEEAWMLNKWQQQQEVVMDDIRRARDPSGAGSTSGDAQEGDVAGVNVGNTIHNHYSSQTAAATDNTQTTTSPATIAKSGLSTLAKVGIAAALVGSGGLGGLAIPAAFNWLIKPSVTVSTPSNDTDTNAAIELGE